MARRLSCPSWVISLSAWVLAVMLGGVALPGPRSSLQIGSNRSVPRADAHQLDAALTLVDQRLAQVPSDLEARGWRGRLLAWQGRWGQAESEYRRVLERSPNDTDILCGLAYVLLWQEKLGEALSVTDHARDLAPSQPSILLRRARILRGLNKTARTTL